MSLEGRIALVTGGGRGIGRGIAMGLAEDGADLALIYRSDEAAAAETAAAIRAKGRRAHAIRASVDNFAELEAAVAEFGRALGPIGILVNNAGIASRGRAVADTDPAEMERVVRVHAFGPFYLSKLVLPAMRGLGRGDIIMISSVATLSYAGNGSPYNMGKAAVEALAFTLAKEEVRHGIRVNIVAPPLVESEMGRRLAKARFGVDSLRDLDQRMPFGHVCQPEDIANVVRFLVSDQNSYVSGEKISVHGAGA